MTIVEYGDLRCPICKQFDNEVIPQVITNLVRTGKAKLQYKTWPILGPNSVVAAQAAYAARQQNALWPYAALTYLNQGDENDNWFTKAIARSLAAGVGLDIAKFDKDLHEHGRADGDRAGQRRGDEAPAAGHAVDPHHRADVVGHRRREL